MAKNKDKPKDDTQQKPRKDLNVDKYVTKYIREAYNRVHGIEDKSAKEETPFQKMVRFQENVLDLLTRHKIPYTHKEGKH